MMKQILIVDDERIIRKGLERAIPWESLGCTVVGTASNGVEGLDMIHKLNPDIVLADVKMPQLNGLDMADAALKINPLLKFIIISGYSDFDNVKKAIKLSAVDFIQKPISDLELVDAINKAKHEIELNHNYHHYVENETLLEIMRGRKPSSLLPYSHLNETMVQIVLIQFNTLWASHEYFKTLHKEAKKYFSNDLIEVVICHDDVYALIVRQSEQILNKVEILQETLANELSVHLSIGISNLGKLINIETLYIQSKSALDYKLVTGFGKIHEYSLINLEAETKTTQYVEMKEQYRLLVKHGTSNELKTFVQNQLHQYNHHLANGTSIMTVVSDLHFILINHLSESTSLKSIPSFEFLDGESSNDLILRFVEYVLLVSELQLSLDIDDNIDNDLKRYIQNNYQQGLSLPQLADQFYLSESTISRKIKSIFDKSFSDVIHDLRIDQASRLLRETTHTVFDIATEVGYGDYRYFSTIFKKINGLTPSDYRRKFSS